MGTQVQCKAMKDLNDDRNGNGWNLFYGKKNLGNGQYSTPFIQITPADAHTGHCNNGLKRKMLEHDAIFKNQVYELHRLYQTQRDMMEDIKTKEGHRHEEPTESSSIKIFGHSCMFLGSPAVSHTRQEKWFANNISQLNPGRSRDPQSCNGFYHGSSSGSKDSPAFGIINGKSIREDRKPLLPWLQANPDNYRQAFKNEASNPDKNAIFISETGEDLKGMIDIKKILGVPIFEKLGATENEASFTRERENTNKEKKNFLFDINVACDVEEVVIEKKLDKSCSARNFIDLNSYVTEDEDLETPSSLAPMRFVADFNLEEPAVAEEEDILSEKLDDEVLMSAAEAIVDISSCPDSAELESLLWFADVAFRADKLENMLGKECSFFKELDDFEAMILLLKDTKEEDYMPKPFVPDVLLEKAPQSRPRRGQARRGRPQRDFQRDILPGLTTISKHDLTEDLQTFDDLMKATGHPWNSGSKRRNGGTRGRKRKAVELAHDSTPVGTSLEDRRSLTSWGKTTRRPRRQRCPASNAPSVALT